MPRKAAKQVQRVVPASSVVTMTVDGDAVRKAGQFFAGSRVTPVLVTNERGAWVIHDESGDETVGVAYVPLAEGSRGVAAAVEFASDDTFDWLKLVPSGPVALTLPARPKADERVQVEHALFGTFLTVEAKPVPAKLRTLVDRELQVSAYASFDNEALRRFVALDCAEAAYVQVVADGQNLNVLRVTSDGSIVAMMRGRMVGVPAQATAYEYDVTPLLNQFEGLGSTVCVGVRTGAIAFGVGGVRAFGGDAGTFAAWVDIEANAEFDTNDNEDDDDDG